MDMFVFPVPNAQTFSKTVISKCLDYTQMPGLYPSAWIIPKFLDYIQMPGFAVLCLCLKADYYSSNI